MDHWTDAMVIRFLRKLETLPCLWDVEDRHFRDPERKASALYKLCYHMDIHGFRPNMTKRKIIEIRWAYIKEKRRMYEFRTQGKVFTPQFRWFSVADSFWGKSDKDLQEVNSNADTSDAHTAKRRAMIDDALTTYLGRAVKTVKQMSELTTGNEFDTFGRSVACQLKSVAPKVAYELEAKIQAIISKKKIEYFSERFNQMPHPVVLEVDDNEPDRCDNRKRNDTTEDVTETIDLDDEENN